MKENPKEDIPEQPEMNRADQEVAATSERANPAVTGELPPPPPAPPIPQPRPSTRSGRGEKATGEASQDPKSISASLRRVRKESGPLVMDVIKQKQDRTAEVVFSEAPVEPVKPVGPAPIEGSSGVKASVKANVERQGAAKAEGPVSPQAGLQTRAQTAGNQVTAVAQSSGRRPSEALSSTAISSSSISSSHAPTALGSRVNPGAMSGPAQYPLNGPSSVLVQASGLKPQSFGSKFRVGVIVFAFLVAAGTYFIVRDNLLGPRPFSENDRYLVRAEEQSEQSIHLGENELKKGNFDVAIGHFRRALDLTPNSQQGRFLLGLGYIGAKQEEEALKVFQSLLRSAPEHLDARLRVAEIYRTRGNWEGAYQELQRVIAFDQNSEQARYALEIIEKTGLKVAEMDANARNARDRRQQKKNNPMLPATIAANIEAPIVALRVPPAPSIGPPAAVTSPSAEDNPDPRLLADTHKKLGVRYLNIREYRAAINEFLSALQLAPSDKDLYYFIGSSYNGLNQPAKAYEYYRRVDSGPYVGPAQSGARVTEKAARDEVKRREQMKNEVGKGKGAADPDKPGPNSLDE